MKRGLGHWVLRGLTGGLVIREQKMLNRLGVVVNGARHLLLNAGAAIPAMEGLEVREVLAAVSWDGGAGRPTGTMH